LPNSVCSLRYVVTSLRRYVVTSLRRYVVHDDFSPPPNTQRNDEWTKGSSGIQIRLHIMQIPRAEPILRPGQPLKKRHSTPIRLFIRGGLGSCDYANFSEPGVRMRCDGNRAKTRCWIAGIVSLAVGLLYVGGLMSADTDANAPAPPPQPIALVGALIRTQSDAGDFVGTIVIKDRQIVAMGTNVTPPTDAQRIDVANHVITPGLIDARSVLWLNAGAAREAGRDGSLNIIDGIDPYADDWRDAARQGVTAVYVQPHNSGNLGGGGAVLRVGPTVTAAELVVRHPAGVQAALGVTGAAAAPAANPLADILARLGLPAQPTQAAAAPSGSNSLTRYAQYESLRGQFDAAKKYGESKPTQKDAGKELLLRAMKKELPVRLEVGHEDDVRNSLKLADLGVRLVFERLDRVKSLPEELAASSNTIVVGPLVGGKKSAETRKLALDGRKFVIGTFGDEPRATSWLRIHAAAAVADGYPRDRVLQAATRDAAELIGASDKLGALAVGHAADLVVFAGDPLDPSVPVRLTMSQGVVTYDDPKAEVAPSSIVAKSSLPDRLPPSYVLKTTRLLGDNGEFAPGELFIDAGKIVSRGATSSAIPTIDVGDAPVTPGLVAANVAVVGEDSPDPDAGHLRATDGVYSDDARWRSYRDGGFLTAAVAPGSANVIAGTTGTIRTAESGAATDAGMKFVLTSAARNNERYPNSLVGQIELIGERLRGGASHTDMYLPAALRTKLLTQREENLRDVRAGRATAYFEAQTRGEVRAALRLIADHRLRGVIVQPKQVEDLADEIRAANVPVVVGSIRVADNEKTRTGLANLGKAGVPVAFGGGDATEMRNTAALLVNAGMPRNVARRGLIAQPAEAFGLSAGSGRLASGDSADFVIWDGDPLDPGSRPSVVVSQGQRVGKGS
jgi:imidazolonepropionase-like amidohydrolase